MSNLVSGVFDFLIATFPQLLYNKNSWILLDGSRYYGYKGKIR